MAVHYWSVVYLFLLQYSRCTYLEKPTLPYVTCAEQETRAEFTIKRQDLAVLDTSSRNSFRVAGSKESIKSWYLVIWEP